MAASLQSWLRARVGAPPGLPRAGYRIRDMAFGRNAGGYSILREVQKSLDDYFFIESLTEFVPRQIRVLYGK
jgi:hypothetical protein